MRSSVRKAPAKVSRSDKNSKGSAYARRYGEEDSSEERVVSVEVDMSIADGDMGRRCRVVSVMCDRGSGPKA